VSYKTLLKLSWKTGRKNYSGAYAGGQFYVAVNNQKLSPVPSLALWNHSPTGFAWGYNGSGPAQLALAILFDYTGDSMFAKKYHQEFKNAVISKLSQNDGWILYDTDIDEWIRENTIKKETWLVRRTLRPAEITKLLESVGLTPMAFYMGKRQRRTLAGYNVDGEWLDIPKDKIEAFRAKLQEVAPESTVNSLPSIDYAPVRIEGLNKERKVIVIITPVYRDSPKIPWREVMKKMEDMGYDADVTTRRNDVTIRVWVTGITEQTPASVVQAKANAILVVLKEFDSNIEFEGNRAFVFFFKVKGGGIQDVS